MPTDDSPTALPATAGVGPAHAPVASLSSTWHGLRRDPLLTVANSPRLIGALLLVMFGGGALAYRLLEGGHVGDGLWWTFVTGSTVGYGDISPKGTLMRIIAVLIMVFAIFLIQLLTAHLTNRLVRDDNVFTHAEQEQIKEILLQVRDNMFTHAEQEEVLAALGRMSARLDDLTAALDVERRRVDEQARRSASPQDRADDAPHGDQHAGAVTAKD